MTGYLLDTNVVSSFAPGKVPVSAETAAWFEQQTDRLFLSAISVIEIEAGIRKLGRTGAGRRADDLAKWFERVLDLYGTKVLPLDLPAGRVAGVMTDRAKATGHNPGLADIAIAAIAQVHGLTILTRNKKHFRPLGVPALDPLERPFPQASDN